MKHKIKIVASDRLRIHDHTSDCSYPGALMIHFVDGVFKIAM